jgi:transketolase
MPGAIDKLAINTLKMLAVDGVEKAKSGHPGMPLGDAAMAYVLWDKVLKHNPADPLWPNRDRFVLSAGHGSILLYSLLYLTGYDTSLEDLMNFRQWGSKTPGHPEYSPEEGIETTTGPLGQGFATGVGMAMAQSYLAGYFNRPGFKLVDYNIFAICGDGDMMEGVQCEAASLAGHLGLGSIVYLYSDNKVTIEGSTELAFTEDVGKRFEAYGWHVQKVDGYDLKGIEKALLKGIKEKRRPSLIIARTSIAHGCPNLQDSPAAHGAPIGEKEALLFKECLLWPKEKPFYVPKGVLSHMRRVVKLGKAAQAKWEKLFKAYKKKYAELAREWEDFSAGRLKAGWEKAIPIWKPEDGAVATRSASGKVLNAIADYAPQLIGGSADLAPSNNTYLKGKKDFAPHAPGRNIHFGVREHAMGAALNGMALSGMLLPYGGTFLVFSDYLRPSMRLSALMGTHVIYVFTHDSIGVGEDGPTHQPIEQLASQRALPNLTVIRPCDANETAEAWKFALENKAPVSLILSRQNLPVLDRGIYPAASEILKGGYVLSDSRGTPDIILMASGSEVQLALGAAAELKKQGKKVRVVNIASFDLFDKQPDNYKEKVLPLKVERRLAIEAASPASWYKYVGLKGDIIGINRFGASAPGKVVFEKFGFTVENVVKRAHLLLKR